MRTVFPNLIAFLFLCLSIVAGVYLLENRLAKDLGSIEGELLSLEEVFDLEPDLYLRDWKRNLYKELSMNLNIYRSNKDLSIVPFETIRSFSPAGLSEALNLNPEAFNLLDVREAVEFDGFHLEGSETVRYGNLANNEFPNIDEDKITVVICYSGIRGYITANLLRNAGYENVAFIRGGLGAWRDAKLPVWGNPDNFKFLADRYRRISQAEVENTTLKKIDFSFPGKFNADLLPNLENVYFELLPPEKINDIMQRLAREPLILVCRTDSECFDAIAFSYLFENTVSGRIEGYIQL